MGENVMNYKNDNTLHTIAEHANRLFVLAEMLRNEGENLQNVLLPIEIENVAISLCKLDNDNNIVITPRNLW